MGLSLPLTRSGAWNHDIDHLIVTLVSDAWQNRHSLIGGLKQADPGSPKALLSYGMSVMDHGAKEGEPDDVEVYLHLVLEPDRWWWTFSDLGPWNIDHADLIWPLSVFEDKEDTTLRRLTRHNHYAFHDLLDEAVRCFITEITAKMQDPQTLCLRSTLPLNTFSPQRKR